jgi:hypothetical protein
MEVATSFARAYFPCELKTDAAAFQVFYGSDSKLTVGDNQPIVGTNAITDMHTTRLSALGEFKIDLKYVDAVSGPHRSVVVSVVGSYITREAEHHFVRGFVLQPTAHRDNAYFVLSEWIRETNVVPERGSRREAAPAVVPAQSAPAPVPQAVAAAPVEQVAEKPVKKTRRPALVKIEEVPKRCTLGDIRLAAEAFGKVLDVKRLGRNGAMIEFQTLRMADNAAKAPEFKVNGLPTSGLKLVTEDESTA